MSLTAIKAQLKTNLSTVSGIVTVYPQTPTIAPTDSDCPAIIMERQTPFFTILAETNGSLKYQWHFHLLVLLNPSGLSVPEEWDAALEPYVKRVLDALWGDITLGANARPGLVDGQQGEAGILNYMSKDYFGFALDCAYYEVVNTTFA